MILSNIISTSFYTIVGLYAITKLYLNWRNKKYILAHTDNIPQGFQDRYNLDDHQKAARYTTDKLNLSNYELELSLIVLLLWLPGGLLNQLDTTARLYIDSELIRGVVIIFSFCTVNSLINLPVDWYRTFYLEERYGFNKTTPKLFFIDLVKGFFISLALGIPLLMAILSLFIYAGAAWWFWAWLSLSFFQILIMWAYPRFLAPLFNKFSPLNNQQLKQAIEDLLHKTGFKSDGVFVMDASKRSAHGNAYFTGLGNSKRIVFFDTLMEKLSEAEILSVLAHELGHFKYRHVIKMLLTSLTISFLGFFLLAQLAKQISFYQGHFVDQASSYMALLILSTIAPLYLFFLRPLSSWLQRRYEFEADAFAAQHTHPQDLINGLVKLYKESASTLTPDPLYVKFHYSHPQATERIEKLTKAYQKAHP